MHVLCITVVNRSTGIGRPTGHLHVSKHVGVNLCICASPVPS